MIDSLEIFISACFFSISILFLLAWLDKRVFEEQMKKWLKVRNALSNARIELGEK